MAAVAELTGEDETPLVALVPYTHEAVAPPDVLQAPDEGAEPPFAGMVGVNIRTIQALRQGRGIQVAGDAGGGVSVTLAINGVTATESVVSNGKYAAEADLDPGVSRLDLKVTLLDGDGKAVASARVKLTRSEVETILGDDSLVVVQKGDALWRIAYRTYGQGIRYVTIFERNRDQIADEDLIYPDQIFVVPKE